ncbi:unnamed protein product [Brassicogethes aeneus]|uniref:Microsomal glutathione S-transferase 1 n=1 Tax=Brassicogethes aeneus TaxID=1431903 RepID=A0A9P0AXE4_BRAAE|nr:unnamed protein product [Brassicogethes aeneus]
MVANMMSMENPLFKTYLFYLCVLGLKMLTMSILTARKRFLTKTFINPEDAISMKVKVKTDDNVERVRRAHLNDIENIPVFFVVSFAYLMTNPAVGFATMLFRAFTAARFVHTFVYAVVVIPQPARALSWGVGYAITWYMGITSILNLL